MIGDDRNKIIEIVKKAGKVILNYYDKNINID